MKKLKSLLIWTICLGLTIPTSILTASANNGALNDPSNYTPERPGVPYQDGIAGFPYPSFNNFTGEETNAGVARENDERKFLIGKNCDDNLNNCGFGFVNTLAPANALDEGDIIKFSVYFHNNGDDPYDNDNNSSPDAQNIRIGIDLKNINTPDFPEYLSPKGFIVADNNEYRTNKNDPNTRIKDDNGNIIRKATDDMKVEMRNDLSLKLEPINKAEIAILENSTDTVEESIKSINGNNFPIQITRIDGETETVQARFTIDEENQKAWITIDHLPGCFRYSGFAFFYARATKPPQPKSICVDMVLRSIENNNINGLAGKELWVEDIAFAERNNIAIDAPTPDTAKLKWIAPENGTFFKRNPDGTFTTLGGEIVNGKKIIFTSQSAHVFYANPGFENNQEVTVSLVPSENEAPYSDACFDRAQLPPQANICRDLTLSKNPNPIDIDGNDAYELSITNVEFSGATPNSAEVQWTSPASGKFYTSLFGINEVQSNVINNKRLTIPLPTALPVYYVNTTEAENEVSAILVDTDNNNRVYDLNLCSDSVKIEGNQPPICAELKVDHPENIFEQTLSSFLGQSINSENGLYSDGKIRYTVDPGFGSFFREDQALLEHNNSPIVFETFDISGMLNIMRNIWLPNNNGWNFNFQAKNGLLSFNPESAMASALMAFVPAPQLGPDLSGVDLSGAVEPLQPDNPIDQPFNNEVAIPVNEAFTANPGQQVWFFAEKPGNGVIHVDQLDQNNKVLPQCTRDFSIIPFSLCQALKVNHDAKIKEQKVTTFEAKALDQEGRDFNGMITYTVDEGHGRFFLVDPGLANNASQRIDEGADGVVNPPINGFCGSEQAVAAPDNQEINWDAAFNGMEQQVLSAEIEPTPTPTGTSTTAPTSGTTIDLTPEVSLSPNSQYNISIDSLGQQATTIDGTYDYAANLSSGVLLQLDASEIVQVTSGIASGNFFNYNANYEDASANELDLAAPIESFYKPGTFNFTSLENNVFNVQELFQQDFANPNRFQLNIRNLQERFVIGEVDFGHDQSFQTLTVAPGTKVWFLAEDEGENVIHVSTECTEVGGCQRDFSIEGIPTICRDFGMEVDPSTQLKVGENAGVRLNPTDQNGNPLPANTKIKVTNTTGGQLFTVRNGLLNQQLTLGDFPATLQSTNQAGALTLSVDPTDPAFSIDCQGEIIVTEDLQPECKALTYLLKEFFSGDQTDTMKENTLYEISSNLDIIDQIENPSVVYSINPNYGAFVKIHNENPFRFVDAMAIKALADNENLNKDSLKNILGDEAVHSVTTVSELETVYFVTFTNTPGASGITNDILEIRAETFGNEECQKSIPLAKELAEKECIDLEIVTPDSPWEITENDDSQLFQIRVRTSPEEYKDDLFYHWEVTDGAGEWREDDETLVAKGDTTQTLENFNKDTEVEVYASTTKDGEKISKCSDSIAATMEEEKEKPKISKYVYPTNDVDEKDTIINIGETRNTPYVTYLIAFTPGDSKSVEIWEDSMTGNKIRSVGSLNGHLDLEEMSINILKDNERNSYAFMRGAVTGNYHEDRGDSSYADENFDYDEDRKIFCDDDIHNQLCIDNADDIDELIEKFGNGEKIRFKNLASLDNGDQIIIKYRVHNYSVINNSSCDNLDSSNGCGEEFDNTIKFDSYEDNNFENEMENGRDSAKVIVICPYVITRGGGDTFFHDIIDTGADVAKCSEVKSCEGVCITPPREKPKRITSTGSGDISQDLKLTLPSHDICKYSNSEENIEGYNDVLENFSSTVCEVRSEVASIWKEKNINESIAANIKRLTRFGTNLSGGDLNTDNADNKASGVFISENDITVGRNGEFIVEGGNGVPAAQTYIINGADLYIKNNIRYGATNFNDQQNIPSVAFIVIDGNIIIDNAVEHLDGIYMAVDLNGDDADGKVTNAKDFDLNNTSDTPLSIFGNLIGNVYELFATRKGYGDPTKDEGSVVVHYDSRILLNTPPGISELVDIDQSLVPG